MSAAPRPMPPAIAIPATGSNDAEAHGRRWFGKPRKRCGHRRNMHVEHDGFAEPDMNLFR